MTQTDGIAQRFYTTGQWSRGAGVSTATGRRILQRLVASYGLRFIGPRQRPVFEARDIDAALRREKGANADRL